MPDPSRVVSHKNPVLFTCLGTSLLLVGSSALKWTLVDWLTPLLMLPLQGAIWLVFAASLVMAFVSAVRNRRIGVRMYLPLAVCALALVVVATVPFTRLWLAANFFIKKTSREEVVRMVAIGELRPNFSHNAALIALPESPDVSAGGNEILVQQHTAGSFVFFFTFRGILGSAAGFLWVPQGASVADFRFFAEELGEVVPYSPNWHFVSTAK